MTPRTSAILFAAVMSIAACAGENRGYTKTRDDAAPFAEAHSRCMGTAMSIGGAAQTIAQMGAYDRCMTQSGWEDRRGMFGGGPR